MPRKKQTVQKQRRRKTYSPGDADAIHQKKRGAFALFSNYKLFAAIGVIALAGGLLLTTLLSTSTSNATRSGDLGVRGQGVIRTTPEPGSTPQSGASGNIKQYPAPPPMSIDTSRTYTAVIKTEKGDITVELDPSLAPQAVNNFVFLAKDGFYNGQTFFRVVADDSGQVLYAQAGDPTGTGSGGPGYTLPFEQTDVSFEAGVLAVARPQEAGAPNNGSQFFFTLADAPTLDGKFTAFGRVVDGLDVLRQLTLRDPQSQQDPPPGVRIESIEITES